MRLPPVLVAFAALLVSCGSQPSSAPAPAAAEKAAPPPKPADESRRFPQAGLLKTEVIDDHLLGKSFMPGGTLAHYRKGKSTYDMFVAKVATLNDAPLMLLEWKNALTDAQMDPSFGGYFGQDAGRPVFVFTKGTWVVGIAGLTHAQADPQARILAAKLD